MDRRTINAIAVAWCLQGCIVDRSRSFDPAEVPTAAALGCSAGQVAGWADGWVCTTLPEPDADAEVHGSCEVGDKVTGVDRTTGEVLCARDVDTDGDTLGALTCADGQLVEWHPEDGWGCGDDDDRDVLRDMGSCGDGQVLEWVDGDWVCGVDGDDDTLAAVGACAEDGEVLARAGGAWQCRPDMTTTAGTVTSITAGTGITLSENPLVASGEVAVDIAAVEARVEALLEDRLLPDGCNDGDVVVRTESGWDCTAEPSCPPGFLPMNDIGDGFDYCYRGIDGGNDEMVKVGDFWIDRYEMTGCGGDPGQRNGSGTTLRACSGRNVNQADWLTWFQAAQMCANAGKRLCTNAEWQAAASGTPDPGPTTDDEECLVSFDLEQTRAQADCVSRFGVYDMTGSRWEWVADWYAAPGNDDLSFAANSMWPDDFGPDATWNLSGGAFNDDQGTWAGRLPAAAIRGGDSWAGSGAGIFAFGIQNAPSAFGGSLGARCCISGG